jgi:hypothetical protein
MAWLLFWKIPPEVNTWNGGQPSCQHLYCDGHEDGGDNWDDPNPIGHDELATLGQ